MSDRIDLNPSATKNLSNQRTVRNIIAVLVVVIVTSIFAIFTPRTEIIKANLVGEGCAKNELIGVRCELAIGEKKLTLRECSQESPCNQSEYKLGKKQDNKQYVILKSESFGKSIEVISIDVNSLTKVGTETAFYTDVKDSCQDKKIYTQDCFDFPISEEQLKDISEQNQKYTQFIKENSLN
jgi:hypothetical protein